MASSPGGGSRGPAGGGGADPPASAPAGEAPTVTPAETVTSGALSLELMETEQTKAKDNTEWRYNSKDSEWSNEEAGKEADLDTTTDTITANRSLDDEEAEELLADKTEDSKKLASDAVNDKAIGEENNK